MKFNAIHRENSIEKRSVDSQGITEHASRKMCGLSPNTAA